MNWIYEHKYLIGCLIIMAIIVVMEIINAGIVDKDDDNF